MQCLVSFIVSHTRIASKFLSVKHQFFISKRYNLHSFVSLKLNASLVQKSLSLFSLYRRSQGASSIKYMVPRTISVRFHQCVSRGWREFRERKGSRALGVLLFRILLASRRVSPPFSPRLLVLVPERSVHAPRTGALTMPGVHSCTNVFQYKQLANEFSRARARVISGRRDGDASVCDRDPAAHLGGEGTPVNRFSLFFLFPVPFLLFCIAVFLSSLSPFFPFLLKFFCQGRVRLLSLFYCN